MPNFLKLLTYGLIVGIVGDWFTAYEDNTLFGIHVYVIISVLSIAAGLLAGYTVNINPMSISGVITLGIAIAVILRVIYDTSIDGSTHNLWPFELIVFAMIGFLSTLVGGFTSMLFTGRKL